MKTRIILIMIAGSLGLISCQNQKEKLSEKIKANENLLFGDSLKTLNDSVAVSTLDLYISYANQFPEDSSSAEFLFKAADLALGINKAPKALESLSLLMERYPNSPKAPSSLFMQAFIHETAMEDKEGAKILFGQFMEKYPDHPLFSSAKASFDQLASGMTDEELIRLFESKQDSATSLK